MCNSCNKLEKIELSLQNSAPVLDSDKFGLVERIMQFPSEGKIQSFLFFATCLPLAIVAFVIGILFIPFWSFAAIDRTEKKTN